MQKRIVAVALAALVPMGCIGVIRVHEGRPGGKPVRLEGIPFYAKKQLFRQSSTYEVRWLDVTLEIGQVRGADRVAHSKLSTLARLDSPGLQDLRETLAILSDTSVDEPANTAAKVRVLAAFANLDAETPAVNRDAPPVAAQLTANSVDAVVVVDYGRTYYLNSPLPWFGTGKLTSELNADGTLSKASSEADTKMAEALSTLLPIKEFLTAELIKPAAAPGAAASVFAPFYFTLQVKSSGYRYTYVAEHETDPCPKVASCILPALPSTHPRFTRTSLDEPAEKPKDDGKAIAFSGSVKLPKE